MSTRGTTILRRLLKRIIRDNDHKTGVSQHQVWRKSLKGGALNRSVVVSKAQEYLAAMKLEEPVSPLLPSALNQTVADLRRTAGNVRTRALERLTACERLARIEGYKFAPQGYEPLDELIAKEMGQEPKTKPQTATVQRVREGARRQALNDIQDALRQDIEASRIRTLSDAVAHLRLPEQEPTAPLPEVNLAEQHRDELKRVLDMF